MSPLELRRTYYAWLFPAWAAVLLIATLQGRSIETWLESWNHWDSHWYESIWQHGYPQEDARTLVYPPGFSMLIGSLSRIGGLSFQSTAMVVNCLSFWATAILFCQITAERFQLPHRWLLMMCFLSSPVSYFCFPAYSDAFFNLMAWILIALSLGHDIDSNGPRKTLVIWLRPVLSFLMPWFRLTGYAFVSWILLRKWFVLTILVTLCLWMGVNWMIAGDPIYFYRATELFGMEPGGFRVGLTSTLHRIARGPDGDSMDAWHLWLANDLLPMAYLLALTATSLWLWWKNERLLAITSLAILAMSHNGSYWRSTVRYDWPLIPLLFLPLMTWTARRVPRLLRIGAWIGMVFLASSQFVLQIWFARAFLAGRWAF